jgi:hypothetical protein
MSLGGEYRISNPILFVSESTDAFSAFYLEIRQALRTAVSELDSTEFMHAQTLLATRIKELLVPKASQLGVELVQIEVFEAMPIGRPA